MQALLKEQNHDSHADSISSVNQVSKISNYKAKVRVNFEKNGYIIKTVDTGGELFQALRLKYEVFCRELLDRTGPVEIDIDEFDSVSDHLVLIDKSTNFIVGTYRLNSTMYANRFYSGNEFDLSNIMMLYGIKLEFGRACILKEHRNGVTIVLLLMGIYEYMKKIDARYLFGCSSMNTGDNKKIAVVYRYLRDHYLSTGESRVFPRDGYAMDNFAGCMGDLEKSGYDPDYESGKRMTPSLIHGAGDRVIPFDESIKVYNRLVLRGKKLRLLITPLISHGDVRLSVSMLVDVLKLISAFAFFFGHKNSNPDMKIRNRRHRVMKRHNTFYVNKKSKKSS